MLEDEIENTLIKAVNWILHSGIQDDVKVSKTYGGFHAFYIISNKEYSYLMSEITGYALTLLAYLYKYNPSTIIAEKAQNALTWLIDFAREDKVGAFKCRYQLDGWFPYRICTFDNAMCLNGLMAWYHINNDDELLKYAKILSEFLSNMQNQDGSFNVRLVGKSLDINNSLKKWSSQPGSFFAKNVIGLLNLSKALSHNRYIVECAQKACDYALRFQEHNGRFITNIRNGSTSQHAHMYTVEGLLVAGSFLREKKYLEAAFKGIDFSMGTQLPDGGFPSMVIGNSKRINCNQRADINAQIIRAASWATKLGYNSDIEILRKGVIQLNAMQVNSSVKKIDGGIYYGEDENGLLLKHCNSWATMFTIQALYSYLALIRGDIQEDIFLLV